MNEQYKQELPAWLQIELEKEEIMKNTKNTHYVDFSNSNADKITSTSTTSMKQETLEEVAKRIYGSEPSKDVEYYAFIAGAKYMVEQNNTSKVNRVEVIQHSPPHNGRAYTNYNAKDVEIQFQDDGKTLKIFLI
jgi:hypothetical protein